MIAVLSWFVFTAFYCFYSEISAKNIRINLCIIVQEMIGYRLNGKTYCQNDGLLLLRIDFPAPIAFPRAPLMFEDVDWFWMFRQLYCFLLQIG